MIAVFWIAGAMIQFSLWMVGETLGIAYASVCFLLELLNVGLGFLCRRLHSKQVARREAL
jgi:hypothetical protein